MTVSPLALSSVGDVTFLPQAIVGQPISRACRVLHADVEHGTDDFDEFEGVGLMFEPGLPVSLKHYRGHPDGTFTIYLPYDVRDEARISGIVATVMRALDISADDLLWQRSDDPHL